MIKVRHRHNVCGHDWGVNPGNFIHHASRCPKCAGAMGRTTVDYRKVVSELTNEEYSVLGRYENSMTKLSHFHKSCGHIWYISPDNFIHGGSRCPKCAGNNPKNAEQFAAEVYGLVGGEYMFQEPYVNNRKKLGVKHVVCGHLYTVAPYSFLSNGSRCPNCAGKKRRTPEEYRKEVEETTNGEYSVIEEFKGMSSRINHLHNDCGHVWETSPGSFIYQRTRCPNCIYSRGEKAVADVLDSLSIEYYREHSFEYLGRKRYDFYIPSLNIAIEYDGEQHFEAVDHWGGEEALKRTQESDALKNDFCDYMGIDLLRIPHWEFDNIDEIVTNFIDTVKLMRSISANGS